MIVVFELCWPLPTCDRDRALAPHLIDREWYPGAPQGHPKEPAVAAHLVAGQRGREPAHPAVLQRLGLQPLLDLRLRAGEGVGAALATQLLRTGLQLRSDTARPTP